MYLSVSETINHASEIACQFILTINLAQCYFTQSQIDKVSKLMHIPSVDVTK